MSKTQHKPLVLLIKEEIEFPTGTLQEITQYLQEQEAKVSEWLAKNTTYLSGNYSVTNITFDDEWFGYEDHYYHIVIELTETEVSFAKRIELLLEEQKQEEIKRKHQEDANRWKKEQQRQAEIRKIESKLRELKGEK